MSTHSLAGQGLARFQSLFTPQTRAKGEQYYLRGAVVIESAGAQGLAARVQGGRLYTVTVGAAGRELHASCDCPAFSDGLCKHIWATLLEAEELKGGVIEPRTALGPQPVAAERPRPSEYGDWRSRLSFLASAPQALAGRSSQPGHEIVYVVDVPATRASQSGLALELLSRRRKANGKWAQAKPLRLQPDLLETLPTAEDRVIAAQLLGAQLGYSAYSSFGWSPLSSLRVPNSLAFGLLPRMCATGRCLLKAEGTKAPAPLAWDDGPAWQLWLSVDEDRDEYRVQGELRRGAERRPLSEPVLLLSGGLVFFPGVAALFEGGEHWAWIADQRRFAALRVPRPEAEGLLLALYGGPQRPRLELPPELSLEETQVRPVPCLALKKSSWRDRLGAELYFEYDGARVDHREPGWALFEAKRRRLLVRDGAREQAALERLRELGCRWIGAGQGAAGQIELAPRHVPAAVRALVAEGWRVEADGRVYRPAGQTRVEVVSGIDWFDVQGAVDFDGALVPLPRVLEALRRQETVVKLDDGTLGMLPEEWLQRFGLLASFGEQQQGAYRFRRSQAGLLDALLAAEPQVELDQGFEQARAELRAFEGVAAVDPAPGFKGTLREYQRAGLGWLRFLETFGLGGCLADDMGLGKTVQVLALLHGRALAAPAVERRPSLVVVPRSLIFNWKEEARRFTPGLRILDHTGPERPKASGAFRGFDLVLTTYGTLRRDALLFKDARFDYAILDEAQAIKNAFTESAKAARLIHAEHRLALSGTPVENHLGELWSLLEFLNPGMLGRSSAFRKGTGELDEAQRGLLARALRPVVLRRTKEQVARDLPPRVEQTIHCELDAAQRKAYDELREFYRVSLLARLERDGLSRSKMQVLEALLRLRQAACHPGLIDPRQAGAPSAKLDTLVSRLEELRAEGHKALVFSQFTRFLAILQQRLSERAFVYEYLDGRTRDRAGRVRRFQEDPDCGLFLVSLKAGGVGLNLTAATYVFLLDPWWNPAVEAQAVDRAHRIGQDRHVFAYRLIARDTVEEKVLELQARKRGLADALLGGDKSLIGDLKREDLELLLS